MQSSSGVAPPVAPPQPEAKKVKDAAANHVKREIMPDAFKQPEALTPYPWPFPAQFPWEKALAVERSAAGSGGVMFVLFEEGVVVLKASNSIATEHFAGQLGSYMGVRLPRWQLARYGHEDWHIMVRSLLKLMIRQTRPTEEDELQLDSINDYFELKQLCGGDARIFDKAFLQIMEFIPCFDIAKMAASRNMEEIKVFQNKVFGHPRLRLAHLNQLGRVIAMDALLNNFDRFPLGDLWANDGNPDNIVYDRIQGMPVAIDSGVFSIHRSKFPARVASYIKMLATIVQTAVVCHSQGELCDAFIKPIELISMCTGVTFEWPDQLALQAGFLEALYHLRQSISTSNLQWMLTATQQAFQPYLEMYGLLEDSVGLHNLDFDFLEEVISSVVFHSQFHWTPPFAKIPFVNKADPAAEHIQALLNSVHARYERIRRHCSRPIDAPLPPHKALWLTLMQTGSLDGPSAALLVATELQEQQTTFGRVMTAYFVFPEEAVREPLTSIAMLEAHPWVESFRPLCMHFQVSVVLGTMEERHGAKLHTTCVMINQKGMIGLVYRKHRQVSGGGAAVTVTSHHSKAVPGLASSLFLNHADICSVLICHDADFADTVADSLAAAASLNSHAIVPHQRLLTFIPSRLSSLNQQGNPLNQRSSWLHALSSFRRRFEHRAHLSLQLPAYFIRLDRSADDWGGGAAHSCLIGPGITMLVPTRASCLWNSAVSTADSANLNIIYEDSIKPRPRSEEADETGVRMLWESITCPHDQVPIALQARHQELEVLLSSQEEHCLSLQTMQWSGSQKETTTEQAPLQPAQPVHVEARPDLEIIFYPFDLDRLYLKLRRRKQGAEKGEEEPVCQIPLTAPATSIALIKEGFVVGTCDGYLHKMTFTCNNDPVAPFPLIGTSSSS